MPNIIKIGQCFTELFKKIKVARFYVLTFTGSFLFYILFAYWCVLLANLLTY